MNGFSRVITNPIADRMRFAMRIDHPDECAALRAGITEIEWLYKIAMKAYRCVGRPFKAVDGTVFDLTVEAKARAYDVLSSFLFEGNNVGVPMVAERERTIEEMRLEDVRCAETHRLERFDTPVNVAMRDRRQLLDRVDLLEAQIVSLHERLVGAHCPGCEPPGCPGISADDVYPPSEPMRSPKEPG